MIIKHPKISLITDTSRQKVHYDIMFNVIIPKTVVPNPGIITPTGENQLFSGGVTERD